MRFPVERCARVSPNEVRTASRRIGRDKDGALLSRGDPRGPHQIRARVRGGGCYRNLPGRGRRMTPISRLGRRTGSVRAAARPRFAHRLRGLGHDGPHRAGRHSDCRSTDANRPITPWQQRRIRRDSGTAQLRNFVPTVALGSGEQWTFNPLVQGSSPCGPTTTTSVSKFDLDSRSRRRQGRP